MLKDIIKKTSIHKDDIVDLIKSKGSKSESKFDSKEKIKNEILNFILKNEDKIKEILPNKGINQKVISLLYLKLPFPIKILLSEEEFSNIILNGNSTIKNTLSKIALSSKKQDEIIDDNDEIENSLIGKTKDTILAQGTRVAINHYIKNYGKVLKLDINTTNKSIDIDILLDGEYEHLSLHIKNYEILQDNNEYFLKINNIVTSRAWIDIAVVPQLEGKKINIPTKYAKILSKII